MGKAGRTRLYQARQGLVGGVLKEIAPLRAERGRGIVEWRGGRKPGQKRRRREREWRQ